MDELICINHISVLEVVLSRWCFTKDRRETENEV